MKKLAIFCTVLALLLPVSAFADSAEGVIINVDAGNNTLTLDNGITYDLPGEFDYSVLVAGMKVLVFYDAQGNKRYISDIEPENG